MIFYKKNAGTWSQIKCGKANRTKKRGMKNAKNKAAKLKQ